jgi:hypothetical protein
MLLPAHRASSSAQRGPAAFLELLPAAARTRDIASHFDRSRDVPRCRRRLAAGWTGPCRSRLACSPNCLGRIKCYTGGALENLITAGAVPPVDIHPVELRLLSALVQLCHCDSASLLQRAA